MKPIAIVGAVFLLAGAGSAQEFFDNFDRYAAGDICAQSSWAPWPPGEDVCGAVTDEVAFSGGRSLLIQGAVGGGGGGGGGDRTVHTFSGVTGGGYTDWWGFRAMVYLPGTASGRASFILLNTFPATSDAHRSVVIDFDSDAGEIFVWPSHPTGVAFKTDQWVELSVEFSLKHDEATYYYDDVPFRRTTWTSAIAPGGALELQAVELYGGAPGAGGHSGIYYDDIEIRLFRHCYADCDDSGSFDWFDFLCFQSAFTAGLPYADCDLNGEHDFFDFLCYQDAFMAGCP